MGISDEMLMAFVPIVAYWLYSGMYTALTPYLEKYRLYTKEEEESKNMISRGQVLKGLAYAQICQVAFALMTIQLRSRYSSAKGGAQQPSWWKMGEQLAVGAVVMDTWMYFTHRLLHTSFFYKHFHSHHHRMVVSYSYGALYNQPLEAFLVDALGTTLAVTISGMTPRTAMYFLTFANVKVVDDHCGFWIPWNPLQRLFTNNSATHSIHHQFYGLKYNLAAPFFSYWDKIMGTYLPYVVQKKPDGSGYEAKVIRNVPKKIT